MGTDWDWQSHNLRALKTLIAGPIIMHFYVCAGKYNVILDEGHFKDLLTHHVTPPPATVSYWGLLMQCYVYCKRGNFRMGVIFAFFPILPFSRKFSPCENKTPKTLLRKYRWYRVNYPHVKGLVNIFAKFFPSENNHVYSNSTALSTVQ